MLISVTDVNDPRLADFRQIKDRRLYEESGKFLAESEVVVKRLLQSTLHIQSVLVTPARLRTLEPYLRNDVPTYVGDESLLQTIVGFAFHRGCAAVGYRPSAPSFPTDFRTIVVLEDLVDVDNLGAMIRNAAGLGADGILLSPRCADPYYRKALRTAVGTTFQMPIWRATYWPGDLLQLKQRSRAHVWACVAQKDALALENMQPKTHNLILLGSEGPGLSPEVLSLADSAITIPMAQHVDSLNVAVAGALVLYHLQKSIKK